MKKNSSSRTGYIHLYNPKEEGVGYYDFHYVNAYKKNKRIKLNQTIFENERYAA